MAMAYRQKIDRRTWWDPAFYQGGYGDRIKRVRRASLGDPARIEALRWRFLTRWEEKIKPKITAAWEEIARLGEAFYQREDDDNNPDEPGRPTRIEYHREWGDGGSTSIDHDFWRFEPSKLTGTGALTDLAELGDLKEWEEVTLPAKIARVTEEKLRAGEAYWAVDDMWRYRARRLERLNQLLTIAIREIGILPQGRAHRDDRFEVEMNGRRYPFISHYNYVEPFFKEWPEPGEEISVITVPNFEINETLIGKSEDLVRTRHGEPVETFSSRKKDLWPNIWVYGAVGVRFSTKPRVVDKILDAKEVTRLLRTAK
jgi:hypothetical protein